MENGSGYSGYQDSGIGNRVQAYHISMNPSPNDMNAFVLNLSSMMLGRRHGKGFVTHRPQIISLYTDVGIS